MAGTVEIGCGACPSVERDDDRLRIFGERDDARHRHPVNENDPGARSHASVLSRIAPLGVRPPLLTTATWASLTCRSPASPRSWVTASWIRPIPCVRPGDS